MTEIPFFKDKKQGSLDSEISKKDEEITVKVQSMFPNCQKYEPCCKDSGYEETMKKVKKIHNYKEMIEDMITGTWNKKPDSPDIWNKKPKGYKITKDGDIGDKVFLEPVDDV